MERVFFTFLVTTILFSPVYFFFELVKGERGERGEGNKIDMAGVEEAVSSSL